MMFNKKDENMRNIKKTMVIVLVLHGALTACAVDVSSLSRSHVTIKHELSFDMSEEVNAMAEKECATFNRKAVFVKQTETRSSLGLSHFECVEKK